MNLAQAVALGVYPVEPAGWRRSREEPAPQRGRCAERRAQVIEFVRERGEVTTQELAAGLGIKHANAGMLLSVLRSGGALRRVAKGVYVLNQ